MTYTYSWTDGICRIVSDGDPLYLTPEEVREELDEAEQKQPYDAAWMQVLVDAVDAFDNDGVV